MKSTSRMQTDLSWYAKQSRDDKVDIGPCKAKTPSTLMMELWYPPIALQLKLNRATRFHIMPLLKRIFKC